MARAAGTGAREIRRFLTRRAATLACCALLAWLANWSVHAAMTLERPLGLAAPICGSAPAPAPGGVCPVCEDSLAAGAGPVFVLPVFTSVLPAEADPVLFGAREAFVRDLPGDAPARAPPRHQSCCE